MHIPDGFLPLPQALVYWAIALVFIGLSLRWVRRDVDEDRIPLLAVLAAGIFAIQFFQLPVGMGASGHLIGAALVAIALGSPYAAVFIITLVLLVQGFLFNDGGITTMGATILNLGVIGGFVGYYSFRGIRAAVGNLDASVFSSAWLSALVPALAAAVELGIAGTFPLEGGLLVMGLYYAVIGLLEGAITVFAIRIIAAARPDILKSAIGTGVTAP